MDKVQNPKQLYVINLGKVRKMVSFCQRLKKLVILPVRRRRKLRFLRIFWRLRLKCKDVYASAGGASENFVIFCRRAVFLCIWKKRLLKLWTFLLGWGGGAGAPSAPPLATGLNLVAFCCCATVHVLFCS